MMLFNDLGQQFGLLSGGCLEADIQRHAARVMHNKCSLTVSYDGSEKMILPFNWVLAAAAQCILCCNRFWLSLTTSI